jgi:hypothetical protein
MHFTPEKSGEQNNDHKGRCGNKLEGHMAKKVGKFN